VFYTPHIELNDSEERYAVARKLDVPLGDPPPSPPPNTEAKTHCASTADHKVPAR
jgi:hypothetical protein